MTINIRLEGWPVARLEAFARILLQVYPIADDPPTDNRIISVTRVTELRHLRDSVIGTLLVQNTCEAQEALNRLAEQDAGLKQRLEAFRARRHAEQIVGELPPVEWDISSAISVETAVRLLDKSDYRLIRNVDDLQEALLEVLASVQSDVAADLPMLYQSPKKHLKEAALQTYIRRRLLDLLPARIEGVQVDILREDQVRYRRRLDLRVIAPYRFSHETATVIIELKWSDNPQTESNLTEQLGRKYLLGERRSHGIYLVAWCGAWRRKGVGRLADRDGMVCHLISQRDEYCKTEPGCGLRIEVFVLELAWRDVKDTEE